MKKVVKIKPFFRWYDLWIGAYWDSDNRMLYVCPFPMFGARIWREVVYRCPECGKAAQKTAHDTGEGWALDYMCANHNCCLWGESVEIIEWPFADNAKTPNQLRDLGYDVV